MLKTIKDKVKKFITPLNLVIFIILFFVFLVRVYRIDQLLGFLTTIASFRLYKLGEKIHSRQAGIIALIVSGFSYALVLSSRWLSNPTPILLSSVVFFWSLWEIVNRKSQWWWIVAILMIGVSLQFESASAIFYLPLLAVFILWQALTKEKG